MIMEEKANKVFNSFTCTLRAYLNIDVHRTFYESIVENEEITLVCDSGYNPEIITSKGFTFRVFSGLLNSDSDYIYYAIKAGAVFKGYISDIDGNGFFDVHISQYVPDGYKNPQIQHPQKIQYTETYYNAWGRKSYYTSYKYQYEIDEINKRIKSENKIFIIGMILMLMFCLGFFFPPLLIFSSLVFCVLGIIGLIQAFFPTNHSSSPTNHSGSELEQQVRIEERRSRERDKEILQQRYEKKRQIEEQRRKEEEQRRKEEEKRRIEEAHKEYQRELQIEYERTHPNDMAIINSLKKPDKFGNILCPKCCSMVIAKLGYCPKCKTKFQLDSSEKSNL
jgi:hypothetical protein